MRQKYFLVVFLSFFIIQIAYAQVQVGLGACLHKEIGFAHVAYVQPAKSLKLVFRPNIGAGRNNEKGVNLMRLALVVAKPVAKNLLLGAGISKVYVFTPLGVNQNNNLIFSLNLKFKKILFMLPVVLNLEKRQRNIFFELAFSL